MFVLDAVLGCVACYGAWLVAAEAAPGDLSFARVLRVLTPLLAFMAYRKLQQPYKSYPRPTLIRMNRGTKVTDFPPPYPNGWFNVGLSSELPIKGVKELNVFGLELVMFRGENGIVSVLDAYCPHLGANLAVGGTVCNNLLRCPFHGWEFDGEGECKTIPDTRTIPKNCHVNKWHVREMYQGIFLWYDADGNAPCYELVPIPETESWFIAGHTKCQVNAHLQEIAENGPDAAHLPALHNSFVLDSLSAAFSHHWHAVWTPHENKWYMSNLNIVQRAMLFGYKIPGLTGHAEVHQVGPGVVQMHIKVLWGTIIIMEYFTPEKVCKTAAQHVVYCPPWLPRFVAKIALFSLEAQFMRDVPVWESKKFLNKPILSRVDGPIMTFRRWFAQFYSPSSITFADAVARENMMDW